VCIDNFLSLIVAYSDVAVCSHYYARSHNVVDPRLTFIRELKKSSKIELSWCREVQSEVEQIPHCYSDGSAIAATSQ
jgi:hypothetical protein